MKRRRLANRSPDLNSTRLKADQFHQSSFSIIKIPMATKYLIAALSVCVILESSAAPLPETSTPAPPACSPVLPSSPPAANCRAHAIAWPETTELRTAVTTNLTALHSTMSDIYNRASCHPDYLQLNQVCMCGYKPSDNTCET